MKRFISLLVVMVFSVLTGAAETKPVSYYHDLVPVFKRSCTGCHQPAKTKGELDITTYAGLVKGGKHGAAFKAGNSKDSELVEQISGAEPSMPKEGDALSKDEVAMVERWITEGAKDDSPADLANAFKLAKPPEYSVPPVISALAFSPDGKMLAVSGYHEVLLHKPDGSGLIARLVGESPRIESLAFSPDGKLLAVSGGAPAQFGEIQIWDMATHQELHSYKISIDSLYGVSFSPTGDRLAFGCADKTLRMITAADGILCFARNPKADMVVYGGDLGMARIYQMSDNQSRGQGNTKRDANLLLELERQAGPVHAVSFSPGGSRVAVGGIGGEVRIYKVSDGARTATLKGHDGAVFAVAFHPKSVKIATGGYDGKVRIFDSTKGELITSFIPVTVKPAQKLTASTP